MKRVVLVTGGFDPIHSGHIELFKEAKKLGGKLVVGVNSDKWLTNKKGKPFMPFSERANIIKHFDMVDEVIGFNDDDGTSCHAVFQMLSKYGEGTTVVFANGGDRGDSNTPEYSMYKNTYGIEFAWGVGGDDKKNSSSWILEEWKSPKTVRNWGWYRVLDEKPGYKVKELVINPGASLSDQKHKHRSEHWYVLKGECHMITEYSSGKVEQKILHEQTSGIVIEAETWHKAANDTAYPCHILEVQYGKECVEEDIVRRD